MKSEFTKPEAASQEFVHSIALDWRQLLECAGKAQRRRRFGLSAPGGLDARFRRGACSESKAAWCFASRRTPKMGVTAAIAGTIPQLF